MTATQEFLADPFGFAKAHALVPALGTEPTDRLKPKVVDPSLTIYQVKGENRVLFAKVEQSTTAVNRYDMQFSATQLTTDWFPVYWLPWNEDQTYRITLKRSDKRLVTGLGDRLVEAHVFVTAALSGCLVHVDGDPWQPTVYHSNAKNLKVTVPPKMPAGDAQAWTIMQKAKDMEQRIDAATLKHPKGQRHYEPQSANAFRYSPLVASEDVFETARQKAETSLGADKHSLVQIVIGTVFGIRSRTHGLWSFYYQALTRFLYSKDAARFEHWVVNDCSRFWPGKDIQKPIPIVIEPEEVD